MHVDEFRGILPVVDEQGERTARVNRLQLSRVTDEQHLRPCLCGERGDAVERKGAGKGCLVDDHELSGPERLAVCLVVMPPFREVLGRDAEILGEDMCGGGRWREADDGCSAMNLFPGVAEGVHRGGLARAGGADEDVDDAARAGDPLECLELVVGEHSPAGQSSACDLTHRSRRQAWARRVGGAVEQPRLGVEQLGRREHGRVLRAEHRGPVHPVGRLPGSTRARAV